MLTTNIRWINIRKSHEGKLWKQAKRSNTGDQDRENYAQSIAASNLKPMGNGKVLKQII